MASAYSRLWDRMICVPLECSGIKGLATSVARRMKEVGRFCVFRVWAWLLASGSRSRGWRALDRLFPPARDGIFNLSDFLIRTPLIPERNSAAVWLKLWPLDADTRGKQARIANHQRLACIKNRKQVTETAQTVGQQSPHDALIVPIRQSHCDQVVALAQDSSIHLRGTLTDYNEPNAVFPSLLSDALEDIYSKSFPSTG